MIKVGRIPYINCFPVYMAIDRGIVPLDGQIVSGVPTELNRLMSRGVLDVSVVSAIEYAMHPGQYFLLPRLAISCDGPVRSVLLLSRVPAKELNGARVIVSRSSMTSVALLELLFKYVWQCHPSFQPGNAEVSDISGFESGDDAARLVIGDAALLLSATRPACYRYVYDLGEEWKRWTGLPFVFAVWVAQRSADTGGVLRAHASLLRSRAWGLSNIATLAAHAERISRVPADFCAQYFAGLDYSLSDIHVRGLSEFFRRLVREGSISDGDLSFLPAA